MWSTPKRYFQPVVRDNRLVKYQRVIPPTQNPHKIGPLELYENGAAAFRVNSLVPFKPEFSTVPLPEEGFIYTPQDSEDVYPVFGPEETKIYPHLSKDELAAAPEAFPRHGGVKSEERVNDLDSHVYQDGMIVNPPESMSKLWWWDYSFYSQVTHLPKPWVTPSGYSTTLHTAPESDTPKFARAEDGNAIMADGSRALLLGPVTLPGFFVEGRPHQHVDGYNVYLNHAIAKRFHAGVTDIRGVATSAHFQPSPVFRVPEEDNYFVVALDPSDPANEKKTVRPDGSTYSPDIAIVDGIPMHVYNEFILTPDEKEYGRASLPGQPLTFVQGRDHGLPYIPWIRDETDVYQGLFPGGQRIALNAGADDTLEEPILGRRIDRTPGQEGRVEPTPPYVTDSAPPYPENRPGTPSTNPPPYYFPNKYLEALAESYSTHDNGSKSGSSIPRSRVANDSDDLTSAPIRPNPGQGSSSNPH